MQQWPGVDSTSLHLVVEQTMLPTTVRVPTPDSLFSGVLKLDVKRSPFQGHSSQQSFPYCQQRMGCRDDSLERGELAFLEKKKKKRKKRRRNSSGGQGSVLPHSPLAAWLGFLKT